MAQTTYAQQTIGYPSELSKKSTLFFNALLKLFVFLQDRFVK